MLTAGSNVTISGTGQAGDPWIINAGATPVTVTDTPTVDLTLVGQDIQAAVKLEPVGNLITTTANGLLVNCAAVQACDIPQILTVTDTTTVDLTLTGDGSPGNPWILKADAPGCDCNTVVTTADTNSIDLSTGTTPLTANVKLDPAAGNILTIGPGGLTADLTTGCGLSGEGTAASPLVVHTTGSSPYSAACGGKVYCETASGKLVVDPEKFQIDVYQANHVIGNGTALGANVDLQDPGLPPIGVPTETPFGPIVTFSVTNPSNCRDMKVRIEVGICHYQLRAKGDGRTNFLAGARLQASGGIAFAPAAGQNHQIWLHDSPDPSSDVGWDTTSSDYIPTLFTLAPGATATFDLQATARIINYTNSSTTIGDLMICARVTGFSV